MKMPLRTLTLSVLGVVVVATLAYAAGTTTDFVYIKPGGGGTPPSNNVIAFENAGTIDFRAAGSVDAGGDLDISATGDIDLLATNRITMNTATGIWFFDATVPATAGYGPAGGGIVNINAEGIAEADVTMPAGGGSVTVSAPTNPHNGQLLMVRFKQGATAGTVSWNAAFRFGPYNNALTATANKTDYFYFIYNSNSSTWDCQAANKNF